MPIGKGETNPADRIFELAELKNDVIRQGYVKLVGDRAKVKLQQVIDEYFGGYGASLVRKTTTGLKPQ